jgi:hypothetical protein
MGLVGDHKRRRKVGRERFISKDFGTITVRAIRFGWQGIGKCSIPGRWCFLTNLGRHTSHHPNSTNMTGIVTAAIRTWEVRIAAISS